MAEGVGFEPTVLQRRTTVFKTVTIDHSDTPPSSFSIAKRGQNQNAITTGYSELGQPDSGLAAAFVPLDSQ